MILSRLALTSSRLLSNLQSFRSLSPHVSLHKMSLNKKKVCIVGSGNWYVNVNLFLHSFISICYWDYLLFKLYFYYLNSIWIDQLLCCRGSAIAKIIGHNVVKHSEHFEEKVSMWVFEEMVDGKKLTEIINETHVNVKYLPKHPLPANIVSWKGLHCTVGTMVSTIAVVLPF